MDKMELEGKVRNIINMYNIGWTEDFINEFANTIAEGLIHYQMKNKFKKVNRVEVIDWTKGFEKGGGRAYVFWEDNVRVSLDLQDNDRTLKIFIKEKDEK